MSINVANSFLTIVGVGTFVPAVMLGLGFPDPVCQGLGRPIEEWKKSPEAKFGLYLYTVSDVCLAAFVGLSFVRPDQVSTKMALIATAVHQLAYLSAAIPTTGLKKEQIGCFVFALAGAALALQE